MPLEWQRPPGSVERSEAFTLSVDRTIVAELSEELVRMLGYSIHPPFVGMVDGMHPKRLLPTND